MQHQLSITTVTLSLGLLFGCSSMKSDVAKTNDPQPVREGTDLAAASVYGKPGIDFPAPFYIGERNARIGSIYAVRDAQMRNQMRNKPVESSEPADEYADSPEYGFEEEDYVIGDNGWDWNEGRTRRDVVKNRASAAAIDDNAGIYDDTPVFPADPQVNVASLAETDLISRFHQANLREIELGALAQERGDSEWVRSLGRRVAMDNRFADRRLLRTANRLEINIPADAAHTQGIVTNFDHLNGADLDRALVRQIFDAQREKHQMLEMARVQLPEDSRLRDLVSSLLPITEQHMSVAKSVSSKYLDQSI